MNHRTTRRTVATVLLVLTPVATTACGDDEADTPADTVTTTAAMKDDTMTDDTMKDDSMKDDSKTDDSMTDDSMKDDGQ